MQRYFASIDKDFFVHLSQDDEHHVLHVMRMKKGDEIEVVDNQKLFLCRLDSTNPLTISMIHEIASDVEISEDVTLLFALTKGDKIDLVLQKATELGVKEIYPTIFNRNVVKITKDKEENKIKRFNIITKNASEQSHRLIVPIVNNQIELKDINLDENEIGILCFENENNISLFDIKKKIKEVDKIKVVIGPEGGITTSEVELLESKGFIKVTLGKRILRSETASFNILSVLAYILELERW